MMDQSIAEFESESGSESKIQSLLQTVPKCSTFSRILGGPNSETLISLIYGNITNVDQPI